ncbi:MAG: hypothetical protein HPY94_04255 [Clostridia bacterium]|nr:hypothetical protein [Clostridia bacterium]
MEKRKTFWFRIAAIVLTFSMLFALSACGGKVNADTDPNSIKSQELTQEQWEESFRTFSDADNFTAKINYGNESLWHGYSATFKCDGNKQYWYFDGHSEFEDKEWYFEYSTEGNVKIFYRNEDSGWDFEVRNTVGDMDSADAPLKILGVYGLKYEDFSFETTGSFISLIFGGRSKYYWATRVLDEENLSLTNVQIKFVDNKPAYFKFEVDGSTFDTLFYDWGETTVNLPDVS